MNRATGVALAIAAALAAVAGLDAFVPGARAQEDRGTPAASRPAFASPAAMAAQPAFTYTQQRLTDDASAMETFRPGYPFWQHIFRIPDGFIAYGSAVDGRLLAVFPTKGDWVRDADWQDPSLAQLLTRRSLPARLDERRDQVASLLEPHTGPVVHNPTRGQFLAPNARRYGSFLREWGAIYERFGVPTEIGLAQAIIESGLNPTRRSSARAVGFCQWLLPNWRRLNQLSPNVIEGYNQTTQAPYCAAYLTVLATKYGSFIPALSEHHSGGTNVGRTLISGARLGGAGVRDRYFLGSQFARDLRRISLYGYRDLYRTYGPRSYLYSEMVFGNTYTVASLIERTPQERIHAMRVARALTLPEITRQTGLSADEVRRFNPALIRQVPARATLYLPRHVKEFGDDVAFWHRPPAPAFASALDDFVRLDVDERQWDDPAFEPVLRDFQRRFAGTGTEEGLVMSTVLAYALDEVRSSGRAAILRDYRTSDAIQRLFERGVLDRDADIASRAASLPWSEPGETKQE